MTAVEPVTAPGTAAPGPMLHAEDATFVRAPEALVYRRLTHLAAWPSWWRGCRVAPLPAGPDGERWAVSLTGARGRRLQLAVRPHGWRHDLGVVLALDGQLRGRSEFWLEPTHGGTVIHHLLVATTPLRRPDRVLQDHRRAVRSGLWGLKQVVQMEVRSSIGLTP